MAEGAMPEAEENFTRLMIGQMKEHWPFIRGWVSGLFSSGEFGSLSQNVTGIEVWDAVGGILEGLIKQADAPAFLKQGCLEKIRMAKTQIKEEWDIGQITGDLCGIFRNMLFAASENIPDMIDKKKARAEDIQDSRQQPFCDEDFYYVPEGLFGKIISLAGGDWSVSEVKEALAGQGILKTEGKKRKYYTINTIFPLGEGKIAKKRMVWLSRNKVDIPFQATWEETIKMKKRRRT